MPLCLAIDRTLAYLVSKKGTKIEVFATVKKTIAISILIHITLFREWQGNDIGGIWIKMDTGRAEFNLSLPSLQ